MSIAVLTRQIRRLSWRLKTIRIRQAARAAFDRTRLGTGPAERFVSSFALAALFSLTTLLVAALSTSEMAIVLGLTLAALASVAGTSAVLIFWRSDDEQLAAEAADVEARIGEARARLRTEENVFVAEEWQPAVIRVPERRRDDEWQDDERPAPRRDQVVACPYCTEPIHEDAIKCRHCGEILSARVRWQRSFNPGVAALLSFFWPGAGHFYKGTIVAGLVWMFVVWAGYACCFAPGVILHVVCMFDSASGGGR